MSSTFPEQQQEDPASGLHLQCLSNVSRFLWQAVSLLTGKQARQLGLSWLVWGMRKRITLIP
eukprot:82065-Pelagomonas_calceolata.AAC.7